MPQDPKFIVIALTESLGGTLRGCSVIPEGKLYPAIYTQVFGPDTHQACEEFVGQNCGNGEQK